MCYLTEIQGVLEMVNRGCRRLMAEGGGHIAGDCPLGQKGNEELIAARRNHVLKLASTGRYCCAEIARLSGNSAQTTRNWITRAGILIPNGHDMQQQRRAAA